MDAELRKLVTTLANKLESVSSVCRKWAAESENGGWSTHQVSANREVASELAMVAAAARRRLAELEKP